VTPGAAALLGAARALPVVWLAPPFGGRSTGARVLVAAFLGAAAWPALAAAAEPALLWVALAREVAVGVALGVVASVPFRAAEAAGGLVESAWAPPAVPRPRALLGDAWMLLALALFGLVGGPSLLAGGFAESYLAFPVGSAPSANVGVRLGIEAGARLVSAAAALAAPPLAAVLITQVVAGLVIRAQPAVEEVLGLPAVQRILGLSMVALALGAWVLVMRDLGGLGTLGAEIPKAARALGGP
jgi:flagellar biosynthesis protein FliR